MTPCIVFLKTGKVEILEDTPEFDAAIMFRIDPLEALSDIYKTVKEFNERRIEREKHLAELETNRRKQAAVHEARRLISDERPSYEQQEIARSSNRQMLEEILRVVKQISSNQPKAVIQRKSLEETLFSIDKRLLALEALLQEEFE